MITRRDLIKNFVAIPLLKFLDSTGLSQPVYPLSRWFPVGNADDDEIEAPYPDDERIEAIESYLSMLEETEFRLQIHKYNVEHVLTQKPDESLLENYTIYQHNAGFRMRELQGFWGSGEYEQLYQTMLNVGHPRTKQDDSEHSKHLANVDKLVELFTKYRNVVASGKADSEQLFVLLNQIEDSEINFQSDDAETIFKQLTGRSYDVALFAYLIGTDDEPLEYWQAELDKSDYSNADKRYLQGIIDSWEETDE